jgi:hypothetical protein
MILLVNCCRGNPPVVAHIGFGAGTGALPLRKIVVRDDYWTAALGQGRQVAIRMNRYYFFYA